MALGGREHEDRLASLGSPGVDQFVNFLVQMITSGYMRLLEEEPVAGYEPFVDGHYLFDLSARPWYAFEIEKRNPQLACRFFPVPPKTRHSSRVSLFGCAGLGIVNMNVTADGVKDACWQAIRALFFYDRLHEVGIDIKALPARTGAMQALAERNPLFEAFLGNLPHCEREPSSEAFDRRKWAIDSFLMACLADRDLARHLHGRLSGSIKRLATRSRSEHLDGVH